MIYFYKDNNDLYHLDNQILPSGNYSLNRHGSDTVISIDSVDLNISILDSIKVTNLVKENGTPYTDLNDLLTDLGNFFK